MSGNLKNRLRRIREAGKSGRVGREDYGRDERGADWRGWEEAGYKTLKRAFSQKLSGPVPSFFPLSLAILAPDFRRAGRIPAPEEILFFDLETTGLSGGAGTLAFLAAFGRFRMPGKLEITQYLLLDYPGEGDFIDALIGEFAPLGNGRLPFVASYNGKCFDSQILKNRCLMNGSRVPEYFHADLLHPARRLWKKVLPDCSQATIETSVLGLDRAGDLPGSLAPEIWFSFLRDGGNRDLLAICEHNAKDIFGLATLFLAIAEIASAPLTGQHRIDLEALALSWIKALRKEPSFFEPSSVEPSSFELEKTGQALLERAAKNGCPRAAIAMAVRAEWQLKDPALALAYTEDALANPDIPEALKSDLEKRQSRLAAKTGRKSVK